MIPIQFGPINRMAMLSGDLFEPLSQSAAPFIKFSESTAFNDGPLYSHAAARVQDGRYGFRRGKNNGQIYGIGDIFYRPMDFASEDGSSLDPDQMNYTCVLKFKEISRNLFAEVELIGRYADYHH